MKKQILEKLDSLPCFSKKNLKLFQDNSDFSFDKNIQNWLKKGLIKKLKNGLYVTKNYFLNQKNKTDYVEFIAGKLVYPSYLSCEYVLQKYNILTEAIYTITSITTKTTRSIENFLGNFKYYNLKPELFIGFDKKSNYFQASKAKALFDYIYLKKNNIKNIEDLRLNTDEINKQDWLEFKKYIKISKDSKMQKLCLNKI